MFTEIQSAVLGGGRHVICHSIIESGPRSGSCLDPGPWCSNWNLHVWVGLTRESLFEILARSETRFLDPKFSRDSHETRKSKLVARLTSRESCRLKFFSETRENRVSLGNFAAGIASYESCRKKFCSKTRFLRVLQTNFVARLASLANRNFVARFARIITNFNPGVLREF